MKLDLIENTARIRPAWDSWYKKQRWRNRSRLQLRQHPLCKMCLDRGVVQEANVADHVIPHRGDPQLFWFGDLQSLCFNHHNSIKQQLETKGFTNEIAADGYPSHPDHPFNK